MNTDLLTLALVTCGITLVTNLLFTIVRAWFSKPPKSPKDKKREQRKTSYTQQYVNGWYRMCNSEDVKVGEVKHLYFFEREFVVFRGVDGKASVTDAACPHMGANLGVGGVVVGNCIRCPFHSWEFDNVDGTCKKIPYQDTIPSTAKLFTYHTVEKYGFVVIWWNSADKEGEPHYPFITVSDLDSDNFARLYNFPYPSIKMHLQEFAENTVDVQHFDILHGRMTIPWTKILIPFIRIDHTSTFSLGKEKHEIEFGDNACLKIFGYKVPGTKVVAKILFYGPGSITLFQFDASFGRTYLWHTHTPNDLMDQNVMFSVWAEKKVPRFLSWYVTGNWISQWYNDVTIWENKVFLRKPLLVKGDGPVMKLRRWYQQFYNRDSSTEW